MLQFSSLYSGSTGNSLFVQSDNTKILVDAGVSGKKIVDALSEKSVDINRVSLFSVSSAWYSFIYSVKILFTVVKVWAQAATNSE